MGFKNMIKIATRPSDLGRTGMRPTGLLFGVVLAFGAIGYGATTAQAEEVTVVSFGGSYQEAESKAFYEPAAKMLDMTIKQDSLKGYADVKLQAQSGNPTWDLIEVGSQYCIIGQREGTLEPIDYDVVTNAKDLAPSLRGENWVGGPVYYSMVLAWNTDKYGNNPPKNWQDFFDTEKFPGPRALYGQPRFMLEVALLGDGVKPDDLYPLDVERAIKKLASVKDKINVFYTSHGQSVQLVKDKEVDMLAMLNGRADAAIADGAKFDYTYNQGIVDNGCYGIVKGAPNVSGAMKVLNAFLSPELQANFPQYFNYGPVNQKAFETGKISDEVRAKSPSAPANLSKQVSLGTEWWVDNEAKVQPKWDEMLQQ